MTLNLDAIAQKHDTDKSSLHHNYTAIYEPLLKPLRNKPITLLGLGWGGHEDPNAGGNSARTRAEYFGHPESQIIVVELEDKNFQPEGDEDRIKLWQGSQDDQEMIDRLAAIYGPFDVIIDDASHLSSKTIRSFELLFRHLKSGGLYFIEDTHASYHEHYYGSMEANENPEARRRGGDFTMMQFFQRLTDEVNFKGRTDLDLFPAKYAWGVPVESMSFYFNMVVATRR
ncbi:O-methyltransferase [Mycobacteroides abscessus]|uniref:class I SAM-dependent methyltransferase n=1 Tax=Mycobacteroides abscessus TaxID=36809 RepID=UPI000927EEB9|nr:class I SAM-dependent methyltransferase [Mycobacteroides abscessus]DAZ90333.1 TPA_asm: methyltransferase [Mycobacterium phage prophiFSQJ01-1]SII41057.1 Rmt2 protein [Mycobacteroides abscessus subsp. abscessus]SIK14130.1 Rmt2 protein [Mycobacteroides abscessus subsp. abscessus]SIN25426.1 Rmt2 protein [Mycobacteroides abscessus subsp. abscessus]SLI51510.1 Rmt2 protein [Mycobacteroides abscessus subsp. abscessus]